MSWSRSSVALLIAVAACYSPGAAVAQAQQSTRIADAKQHQVPAGMGYPYRNRSDYVLRELDLRPGDAVVDIGAGDGWWSEKMAGCVGPGGAVHAAEIKQEMVDKLKQKFANLPQIKPYLCQPDDPALPEAACDLAFISQVYHHLPKDARVEYLRKLRRAIKPQGRLCVIEKYSEIAPQGKDHGTQLSVVIAEAEQAGWVAVRCELMPATAHYLAIFAQKDLFAPQPATKPGS